MISSICDRRRPSPRLPNDSLNSIPVPPQLHLLPKLEFRLPETEEQHRRKQANIRKSDFSYLKNKIAQGEINIFRHFIYAVKSLFRNVSDLIEIDFLNRKNIIRFEFSMSELVENDTSLAYIGQFWFWREFWAKNAKNRTRGS